MPTGESASARPQWVAAPRQDARLREQSVCLHPPAPRALRRRLPNRHFGSTAVFFIGPQLAETYLDPAKIQLQGAMPANMMALFGGNPDIVPLLDGVRNCFGACGANRWEYELVEEGMEPRYD